MFKYIIFDLSIATNNYSITNFNGYIKDNIDFEKIIKNKYVEEITSNMNYNDYFINKYQKIPILNDKIFKYFKCYTGSYNETFENNISYNISITFYKLINIELLTEKIIDEEIKKIYLSAYLIENNMINPSYNKYRFDKFITTIESKQYENLIFCQPEFIKTKLWDSQLNNIAWLINMYNSENTIRFSNNVYLKLKDNLILDFTASTKSKNQNNDVYVKYEDIPEQIVKGCIICDEPSMGKTLQILTFVGYIYLNFNVRSLIIYPDHLEEHWQNQAKLHFNNGIQYNKFFRLMSFTKFSNIVRRDDIEECEVIVVDELHETYDPKKYNKYNNYQIYQNLIRFTFRFKIGLTSTPFILDNSLFNIIQYLCQKTFYNSTIGFIPEIQNQFIKYFKKNLEKNIRLPDVNIVNIPITFNRYERDIYDSITFTNKDSSLIKQLEICCNVYMLFESNINDMKTPKDLRNDILKLFQNHYKIEFDKLKELEIILENINLNHHSFTDKNEYLNKINHYENEINKQLSIVNEKKSVINRYTNTIDNIEKIIKYNEINDELNHELNDNNVCAICLNPHTLPISFFKLCGHYFCKICIDSCESINKIDNNIKCPYCRTITKKENILNVTNTLDLTMGSKYVQLIKQIKNSNEKFIIFTQFKKLLSNIQDILNKYAISNSLFDTQQKNNFMILPQVVILSSDDTASGIDSLTEISNMIIFEPFLDITYGKQIEKQLIGRIRRIGQKNNIVNVYRYYVIDTIEEKIYLS